MNNIKIVNTDYLKPSRTLETILLSNKNLNKFFYVYNYEGISYRVFSSYLKVINFFQEKSESDYYFDNETDLDGFLLKFSLAA